LAEPADASVSAGGHIRGLERAICQAAAVVSTLPGGENISPARLHTLGATMVVAGGPPGGISYSHPAESAPPCGTSVSVRIPRRTAVMKALNSLRVVAGVFVASALLASIACSSGGVAAEAQPQPSPTPRHEGDTMKDYTKPSDKELKERLTPDQY